MGDFSNLWGWGGAIAFTAGFGLAAMVYTSDPRSHSYGRAILVGFIGGALLSGMSPACNQAIPVLPCPDGSLSWKI